MAYARTRTIPSAGWRTPLGGIGRERETQKLLGMFIAPVADSDGGGGGGGRDDWMASDIVAPLPGEPWPKWQKGPLPGYPWPKSPIYVPEEEPRYYAQEIPSDGSGGTSVVAQPVSAALPVAAAPALPSSPTPAAQALLPAAPYKEGTYQVIVGPGGRVQAAIDTGGQSPVSDIASWFQQVSLIPPYENWKVLGVGAVALLILRMRRGR